MGITRAPVIIAVSAAAIGLIACNAYADRIASGKPGRPVVQEVVVESPYTIELLDENGDELETFQHNGSYYILGRAGERYTVRVANPTDHRVEAVVSVDGLDVIDGEDADFVNKRGYVVPAGGELRIDGYRVSTSEVAAFRFSSVRNSYAGRKGKARNVGVIGLAIFEEKEPPQVILEQPVTRQDRGPSKRKAPDRDYDYDFEDDTYWGDIDGDVGGAEEAPASEPAPPARGRTRSGTLGGSSGSGRRPSADKSVSRREHCCKKKKERSGLGTAFGERRYSAVSWTRFERRNAAKPDAFAELRYNDSEGLRALGIEVGPVPDRHEIELRETADPFPRNGFATPPR